MIKERSFDQIAGYKEEKEQLINYARLLNKIDELKEVGGKLPKGLLLKGPNGVGKTILAESFIRESKINTVEINYNDTQNDEEFVALVKDKFKEAASKTPCILYVDEFDKLVGGATPFMSEELVTRSRVFLNEMNKYNDVDDLFILAVANNKNVIDESLKRSGRIDKIIEINNPTEEERKLILKYYLKNKKVSRDVDINEIAILLSDFSCADIEALVNNALISMIVDSRNEITKEDIVSNYYNKIFKTLNKDELLDDKNLKILAIHEGGHAACNLLLNDSSIQVASILSRNNIKGFVHEAESEKELPTLECALRKVKVLLAGKIAEEILLKDVSLGSAQDLNRAKSIITDLVRSFGYFGLKYVTSTNDDRSPFDVKVISDITLRLIEEKEEELSQKIFNEAKTLIQDNIKLVELISNKLMIYKALNKEELLEIYQSYLVQKE